MMTRDDLMSAVFYDASTGFFHRKNKRTGEVSSKRAGYVCDKGYRRIGLFGKFLREHRLAWLYVYGAEPEGQIDHIDRDPNNNRITNLRVVTNSENCENKLRNATNKSGFKGVYWHSSGGAWAAQIRKNKKAHYLGLFSSKEDAYAAYSAAAAVVHTINPCAAKRAA